MNNKNMSINKISVHIIEFFTLRNSTAINSMFVMKCSLSFRLSTPITTRGSCDRASDTFHRGGSGEGYQSHSSHHQSPVYISIRGQHESMNQR